MAVKKLFDQPILLYSGGSWYHINTPAQLEDYKALIDSDSDESCELLIVPRDWSTRQIKNFLKLRKEIGEGVWL